MRILMLVMALFLGTANAALPKLQQACMAEAILHEAAYEPPLGWELVYWSIINRASDRRWKPTTPCGVIWQPYQYSFTLWSPEKLDRVKKANSQIYNLIVRQVITYDYSNSPEGFEGVNHYLRCDIRYKVKWWRKMDFLVK